MNIEHLAEKVHDAYIETCNRLGWSINPVNDVPYSDLTEDSKELDRASVRAVLNALNINEEKFTSTNKIKAEIAYTATQIETCYKNNLFMLLPDYVDKLRQLSAVD